MDRHRGRAVLGQGQRAVAIALGTWLGGWRIIRTLGKGLVDISPAQGMAAESSSAAVILSSSHLGFALSTTHVATGSILGSGVGRGAPVRWNIAGRMVAAWADHPAVAGLVGALMWFVGNSIGGALGAVVIFAILVALSTWMWSALAPRTHRRPQRQRRLGGHSRLPSPGRRPRRPQRPRQPSSSSDSPSSRTPCTTTR